MRLAKYEIASYDAPDGDTLVLPNDGGVASLMLPANANSIVVLSAMPQTVTMTPIFSTPGAPQNQYISVPTPIGCVNLTTFQTAQAINEEGLYLFPVTGIDGVDIVVETAPGKDFDVILEVTD